jgi:hypothetical protein
MGKYPSEECEALRKCLVDRSLWEQREYRLNRLDLLGLEAAEIEKVVNKLISEAQDQFNKSNQVSPSILHVITHQYLPRVKAMKNILSLKGYSWLLNSKAGHFFIKITKRP